METLNDLIKYVKQIDNEFGFLSQYVNGLKGEKREGFWRGVLLVLEIEKKLTNERAIDIWFDEVLGEDDNRTIFYHKYVKKDRGNGSMEKQLHLLDVGILLTKNDMEFDYYNRPYGNDLGRKKYAFYDEDQTLYPANKLNETIKKATDYVKNGVDNTYAIIVNEGECKYSDDVDVANILIDDIECTYELEDVIFSVAKINGKLVENFINDIYDGKLLERSEQ